MHELVLRFERKRFEFVRKNERKRLNKKRRRRREILFMLFALILTTILEYIYIYIESNDHISFFTTKVPVLLLSVKHIIVCHIFLSLYSDI